MKAADRLGASVGPRQPVAATGQDVRIALDNLTSEKAKVALILMWYSCARPCDVRSAARKARVLDLNGGAPREWVAPEEVRINDWLAVTAEGDVQLSHERAPGPPESVVDRSGYALHAKPQTRIPIDLAAVDAMAKASPEEVAGAWSAARRLLTDADGIHSKVPWDGRIREAKLRPGDIVVLLRHHEVPGLRRLRLDAPAQVGGHRLARCEVSLAPVHREGGIPVSGLQHISAHRYALDRHSRTHPRTARAEGGAATGKRGGVPDPPRRPARIICACSSPVARPQALANFSSLIAAKSLTSPPIRLVA